MSKSKKVQQPMMDTGPWSRYSDYLKGVDTSNVDNTLSNLTQWAEDNSTNLSDKMGNYTFNVNASDEARKRAEDATYNAYLDRLMPEHERQTDDLQTRLVNQGLSVGSEAYERAMSDLQNEHNKALNQASYQSVLAGQDAFSQDLQNQINAGAFGNQSQQAYISQLLSALEGSVSGYENQQNIFGVDSGKAKLDYEQALASALAKQANKKGGFGGALSGAIKGGMSGLATGNPYLALASAGLGAYQGYNS